ncbi:MAG TPA: NAD(P)-dependent oxidoreductase, partial [Candidatus Handelsmanbacteria bacterium]|nr:NAD(P)-dependent oxidoreductase [Candidatus Handelsmanbacteria bacterium]
MSSVLITGASGFIGRALAASMAGAHDVICMSRQDPGLDLEWIRGESGTFEDLRQ